MNKDDQFEKRKYLHLTNLELHAQSYIRSDIPQDLAPCALDTPVAARSGLDDTNINSHALSANSIDAAIARREHSTDVTDIEAL